MTTTTTETGWAIRSGSEFIHVKGENEEEYPDWGTEFKAKLFNSPDTAKMFAHRWTGDMFENQHVVPISRTVTVEIGEPAVSPCEHDDEVVSIREGVMFADGHKCRKCGRVEYASSTDEGRFERGC